MKIKELIWDSNIFKIKIANLNVGTNLIDAAEVGRYLKENKIQLCQCCLDIADRKNINILTKNNFDFVDLKMIFRIKPFLSQNTFRVEQAKKSDILAIQKIAGEVFYTKSRFNFKNIARIRVNNFYKIWAEKAVLGTYDDLCYVAKQKNKTVGFITYNNKFKIKAVIGLIGVDNQYQGKGIGSALLAKVINRAYKEDKKFLEVATEGSNITAQNFYTKHSFKLVKIKAWYYKWTDWD